MKHFPLFLMPDVDIGNPGAAIDSAPPGPGPSVTDVILESQPAIESSPAVKAIEKPPGGRTTLGPTDFGMDSPEESQAKIDGRERDESGRFKRKEGDPKAEEKPPVVPGTKPIPAPAKPAPVAAKPAPAAPKPAAVPTPTPIAKVKIGDDEKTPEEWAKEVKDLRAKAESAAAQKTELPPPPVKEPEQTLEEITAAEKQREADFFEKVMPSHALTPEEVDSLLSGDPKGVTRALANAELRTRKFAAEQINKVHEHYAQLLAPILEQNQRVQQVMQETSFIGAHEDIKSHPQGLETFRKVSNDIDAGLRDLRAKVAAGTASRRDQGILLQYEDATPEELNESKAAQTRAALAKLAPVEPVAAPPAPKNVVTMPASKPLHSDRPGGSGSPRTESMEARLARETLAG